MQLQHLSIQLLPILLSFLTTRGSISKTTDVDTLGFLHRNLSMRMDDSNNGSSDDNLPIFVEGRDREDSPPIHCGKAEKLYERIPAESITMPQLIEVYIYMQLCSMLMTTPEVS